MNFINEQHIVIIKIVIMKTGNLLLYNNGCCVNIKMRDIRRHYFYNTSFITLELQGFSLSVFVDNDYGIYEQFRSSHMFNNDYAIDCKGISLTSTREDN